MISLKLVLKLGSLESASSYWAQNFRLVSSSKRELNVTVQDKMRRNKTSCCASASERCQSSFINRGNILIFIRIRIQNQNETKLFKSIKIGWREKIEIQFWIWRILENWQQRRKLGLKLWIPFLSHQNSACASNRQFSLSCSLEGSRKKLYVIKALSKEVITKEVDVLHTTVS